MFTPTAEQLQIKELFLDALTTRASLVIQAGAGTGKTSTLQLLAESTDRSGQYIAFNKAIVEESKAKFPSNVECNTAHSLAYRAIMTKPLEYRLRNSTRIKSWDVAKMLGIVNRTFGGKTLTAGRLASIVMRMVTGFCQSGDTEITVRHMPYLDGLDESMPGAPRVYTLNNQIAAWALPYAKAAWNDIQQQNGKLPFKHEHYLKMYQLSNPVIKADFILFDEAQDANPVMQAIVAAQTHATVVWVGDSQQQIYSFTGAINALTEIEKKEGTKVAFLTQSFRFGDAVAEIANEVLAALDAKLRLKGFDKIDSKVEAHDAPNVYLTRTNAAAMQQLLDAQRAGKKVFLVGKGTEILSFTRAAEGLMAGKKVEHADLACFDSWAEVQDYVRTDDLGAELKMMVSLIDQHGTQAIIKALGDCESEEKADLVISTAHKSKGREWEIVQLAGDFPDAPQGEELRLMYVAVTRAQIVLDITQVRYFNSNLAEVA